jgi:iron complex outermembrane receptor protein
MLYTKYSRGYRQGGVLPRAVINTYGPETIDAYEAGTKISFSSDSISGIFNVAAFHNELKDQQLAASFLLSGGGGTQQGLVNIGSSRVYGVEIDSQLQLLDAFRLDLGAAYLNTKVTDIGSAADLLSLVPPGVPVIAVNTSAVLGQPLPLAPEYRVTATGTYALPIPESAGNLEISATYVYTSEAYSTTTDNYDPANASPNNVEATNLVNANIDWRGVAGSDIDLSFFVTNLFDEEYITARLGGWDSLGFANGRQGEPRMFGARLRYSFGASR